MFEDAAENAIFRVQFLEFIMAMKDEVTVKFVVCLNCELVWPAGKLLRHDHEFETDKGDLLVVFDYHCPECRAKLASWGTQ